MSKFVLVLGTRNKKKRKELEYLLAPFHEIELRSLEAYPAAVDVEETGSTFEENANLKASQQARNLGEWVLGEDSGLSVTALNGEPGVRSARFSGPDASDEQNNSLLLERLQKIPMEKRTAWYTCHMALAAPDGTLRFNCEGRCYGRILPQRKGDAGFGYDPLFEIAEYGLTFGQLGDSVKSILSHRARANRLLVPKLLRLVHEMQ